MSWSPPGGRVPPHCLEYEVQVAEDAGGAAAAWAVRTAPGCPGEGKGKGKGKGWGSPARAGSEALQGVIEPGWDPRTPRVFLLDPLNLQQQLRCRSQQEDPGQHSLPPPASQLRKMPSRKLKGRCAYLP